MTRRLRAYVERQDDGPLQVTAATEGAKADGLDLRMDRVRLDRWRANPVVLLEHFPVTIHASMPAVIGRADNIDTENERLRADVTFDTGSTLGAEVDRQYRAGFLHAFSIGFDHGEVDQASGRPDWWEPVELSAVPVPMDGDALIDDDSRSQLVTAARAMLGDRDVVRELRDLASATTSRDVREAISSHNTATDTESTWDGGQAVANAPNDAGTLRHMHAWRDPDGDASEKQSYKLPHHQPGTDTAANINAVNNALARLSQSDIPDSDRDDVEKHLRDHREDAGLDRGLSDVELRAAVDRVAGSIVRVDPADWLFRRERQLRSDRAALARRRQRQRLNDLTTDATPPATSDT
jgi:hypothetical protein